jgi:hypothetical protein
MNFSMAMRVLTFGAAVAAMIMTTATASYAHKAKTRWDAAKAPQYGPEPNIKLRYYGGPKSPMYP